MTRLGLKVGAPAIALLLGTAAAWAAPEVFDSPDAAAAAVAGAIEAQDATKLIAIFGKENEDVVLTGNHGDDRETWRAFLDNYRTFHRVDTDANGEATLYIGRDLWPFPAPIVRSGTGWSFDAASAREEVRLRRIGQNELDVIDLMRKYVRAQATYRAEDPDGGLPAFAQSILSSPGKRDGLYWPPDPDAPQSPIGDFMARAAADGYNLDGTDEAPEPYLGYYYRILTKQGPEAPGGALDYKINGHMVAGHALLAYPADYGETGVMSFLVGEAGNVYQSDLGPETLKIAGAIESFNPGKGWTVVTGGGE